MPLLLTEDRDGVRHLVLGRPDKRNALSGELIRELGAGIEAAAADDAVRVVVLRGEGAMFSSGMDLNDLRDLSEDPARLRDYRRPILAWWNLLEEMPKPTICQIHGAALGGAFELALACDFRTMAEDAVAGIMEVRIGRLLAAARGGRARQRQGADHDRQGHRRARGAPDRIRQPDRPVGRAPGGHRRVRLRAAGLRAPGGGAGEAGARRGGQAGARADAGAGGGGAGDPGGERGLRRRGARVLREARPGLRRAVSAPFAADKRASFAGRKRALSPADDAPSSPAENAHLSRVYFRMTGYHPIEAAEAGFRHIVGSPDPASAIGDEPGPRHPGSLHSSCLQPSSASRRRTSASVGSSKANEPFLMSPAGS